MSVTITPDDRRRHIPYYIEIPAQRAGAYCRQDPRCDPDTTTGVFDAVTLECVQDSQHLFREPDAAPANREPFLPDGAPNPATCHDVRSLHRWMERNPPGRYPTTNKNMTDKEKALIREMFQSRPDAAPVTGQVRARQDAAAPVTRQVRARPNAAPVIAKTLLDLAMDTGLSEQNIVANIQNIFQQNVVNNIDALKFHAWRFAYLRNLPQVVQFLLQWRGPGGELVDPRSPGADGANNGAIRRASHYGFGEIVDILLQWRGSAGEFVDPRANDNEALRLASEEGHTETVVRLLNWRGPGGEFVDPWAAWSADNAPRALDAQQRALALT